MIVNVFVVAMRSYVVGTRSALEQRASREVITLTEAHDSPVMTFDIARRLDPKLAHTLLQERLANNEDKEVSAHTNAPVLGTVTARFNSQERVFFALHDIESRSEAQGKVYAFHHDRSFFETLAEERNEVYQEAWEFGLYHTDLTVEHDGGTVLIKWPDFFMQVMRGSDDTMLHGDICRAFACRIAARFELRGGRHANAAAEAPEPTDGAKSSGAGLL